MHDPELAFGDFLVHSETTFKERIAGTCQLSFMA
jgi:hypothetical protein